MNPQPREKSRAVGRDLSPRRAPRVAERRCIATGVVRPKTDLIRFVVDGENRVVPDLAGRLPGRGMWLAARREVIEDACKRNLFARSARATVLAAHDLPDAVASLQRRKCLDLIGVARRSGQLAAGFENVRAQLKGRATGLLLAASDGADDGRGKLRRIAPNIPVVTCLESAEIGAALGRGPTVHAALLRGNLATKIWQECERLEALERSASQNVQPLDGC